MKDATYYFDVQKRVDRLRAEMKRAVFERSGGKCDMAQRAEIQVGWLIERLALMDQRLEKLGGDRDVLLTACEAVVRASNFSGISYIDEVIMCEEAIKKAKGGI